MKVLLFIFCLIGALFGGGCVLTTINLLRTDFLTTAPTTIIFLAIALANIVILVTLKAPLQYISIYKFWGRFEVIVAVGMALFLFLTRQNIPALYFILLFLLAKGLLTILYAKKNVK